MEESTTPAEALASAAARDVIVMGVGAVMALHSVPEAKARGALAGVATRLQVPVTAVAQAVLTLVAGTDEAPLRRGLSCGRTTADAGRLKSP